MGDDLNAFMDELGADARAAGIEADLDAYLHHFELATQVQTLRAARGLTQTALARSARVPQSEISRLETGRGNPTLQTLARIAAACGARLLLVPQEPRRSGRPPSARLEVRKPGSPARRTTARGRKASKGR